MRELVYYVAVSLDGYIAAEDGDFSAFPVEGDHMAALMSEYADAIPTHVQRAVGIDSDRSRFDTVVMGWDTYRPALAEGIDSPYAHLRQYVASRRPRVLPEGMTATDDPIATVRALKAEPGGSSIYLAGGGQLASALVDEIDRLEFKVNPLVLGSGIPVFARTDGAVRRFALDSSRSFASGVVLNRYVRRR